MFDESAPECNCNITDNGGVDVASSDPSSSSQCCLKQRFWWLLRSQNLSNVCFSIGSGSQMHQFHAHKDVLSAGSSVFKSMFSENWASESVVEVPDVEPPAFSVLLRFLYTDDVFLTADSVMQVLYVANKYAVLALENQCIDFLEKQISPENAFTLLIQGKIFEKPKLVESCLKLIDDDTQKAVESDGFTCIDLDTLCSILKRDTLKISEYELFAGAVRWSEAECTRKELPINPENQRSVLKGALYLVRFPLLSLAEFSSRVAETGLLLDQDLIAMFLYFTKNKISGLRFNVMPRSSLFMIANRFHYVSGNPCACTGDVQTLSFVTDHDVQLTGIGMYGCAGRPRSYSIEFRLFDDFRRTKIVEKHWEIEEPSFPCSENKIRLMFSTPVELNEHQVYQIEYSIRGPDSFCGKGGMHNVIMKLPGAGERTVKIKFFHKKINPFDDDLYDRFYTVDDLDYYNLDGIENGQLPELLFRL